MVEIMDYRPYLDGDVWPSESKAENVYVGDMPPQHAASALAKLMRWARDQPALDHSQELENEHTVRASRLCAFLEARATSRNDFVFDGVTANGVIASVHPELPYGEQLAVYATALSHLIEVPPGELVRAAITFHTLVDGEGYALIKKES